MAGLLDLFSQDPTQAYGAALDPQQRQAIAQQGLLSLTGALGAAGQPSRLPINFGASLAQAVGAAAPSMTETAKNALQGGLLGAQGAYLRSQQAGREQILGVIPQLMQRLQAQQQGGQSGPMQPQAMPGSAAGAAQPTAASSDPRGVAPLIAQTAQIYGIDPNVAVRVAQSEGLSNPVGDGGTSGGAFQLHVTPGGKGNAVGDQFVRDTGLDPLDPKNEPAAIDYAMRYAANNGWGAFKGAARAGIAPFQGIGAHQLAQAAPQTATDAMPAQPPQGLLAQPTSPAPQPMGGGMSGQAPQGLLSPQQPQGGAPQPMGRGMSGQVPQGLLAPPQLPQGIDPAALALGATGVAAGAYGLGDLIKPLENTYYNSPGYLGAKAAAEKWGGVPADIYTAFNKPMVTRPGGSLGTAAGGPIYTTPTLQETVGPNGAKNYTYMSPQGAIPTGQTAALSPQDQQRLAKTGENQANLGPVMPNAGGAPTANLAPGSPALAGAAVAPPLSLKAQPSSRGTVLPPTTQQALPQSATGVLNAMPEWTQKPKEWQDAGAAAQIADQRLQTIQSAFQDIQTGAWQEEKADMLAKLKAIGINLPGTADISDVELALHENYKSTLQTLKAANPRFTGQEFRVTAETSEHPDIQPGANFQMLSEDRAILRQAQQLPQDWIEAQNMSRGAGQPGWVDPGQFQTAWQAANPLSKTVAQVKQEIGSLKGMLRPMDSTTQSAAAAAIAKGAPRDAVIKRLQDNGFNPSGL